MAKKSQKKTRKVDHDPFYGFIVFNQNKVFEHITGYYWNQQAAARAATEYLKTHPTWSVEIVRHQVLQTISFDLTPVIE